ncbi:hypothetical protein [Hydrogenophaga sp. BPS33]|uniref:hypothetical protein n=1 Tax=Hydrogenophaga sp. BPS33 TaxID=2651974 RepID=UPI0013204CF7|nr:hypothetical protein [Hydrogenophaga sp. BPS33]QHE88436.1 hypothetical protein F9K07_27915 [Hydrogenophaga sp. BPS33]
MQQDITAEALFGPLPINMDQLAQLFQAARAAGEGGQTLGQARKISARDLDALCNKAMALCDEERWQEAGLIALQLALHDPRNSRFLFLAGTCLQRMMEFQAAAGLFGLSSIDNEHPIVVFRMAECLAAASQFEPAREAFDACHEMCRGHLDLRDLQDACADALTKLTQH